MSPSRKKDHSLPVGPHLYDRPYFLSNCGGHELYRETRGALLDERLCVLFQMAEVQPGMRVLDLGCGRGELVRHLAEAGAAAWGVDISSEAIGISRETLEAAHPFASGKAALCMAKAQELPLGQESFDRVILSDILEHLSFPDLKATLREVHRVLRPDGLVLFHTFPNRWFYTLFYPLKRLFWDRPRGLAGPRDPRTPYERLLHVHELSAWDLWVSFRKLFRVRIWCAHRSRWEKKAGRFRRGLGPLGLLAEPEIWGTARKR